jgi:hypothetical protein
MPQGERAEYGICEILRGARAAGLGFTIDLTHVVTCAHVINTALGRADKLDRLYRSAMRWWGCGFRSVARQTMTRGGRRG